jgi:hypothetical protein
MSLLPGHPTVGGFGAPPLKEHVWVRWPNAAPRYLGNAQSGGRALLEETTPA